MSELEPLGGDTSDADQAQEGNRPAENARLTTPGHLSTQGYQGSDDAGDFLGLEDEVAGSGGAFELMQDPGAEAQPEEPVESAWVETGSDAAHQEPAPAADAGFEHDVAEEPAYQPDDMATADTFEGADTGYADEAGYGEESYDESHEDAAASTYAEGEGYDDEQAYDDEADLHGSWSEEEPKRGGAGKLVGVTVGLLVVGALGVAGMKFMGATQDDGGDAGPVASRPQPGGEQAGGEQAASVLATVEDQAGDERVGLDADGEPVQNEAGLALDAEAAREAFEAERGDAPPTWFDPELDSQAEPAETGWTEEAEAVTRASTFVGDPTALLAMDGAADEGVADTTLADADVESETTGDERPPLIVLGSIEDAGEAAESSASDEDATTTEVAADLSTDEGQAAVAVVLGGADEASTQEPAQETTTTEVDPEPAAPVTASSTTTETQPDATVAAATGEQADVGPAAPTGAQTSLSVDGALGARLESRVSRTSTLDVEDVLLAPTMDASNLRQADAKDLKGVWEGTEVPMQALDNKSKVRTPNVGRVRVVLKSKDIFEGKLDAVGLGSVWLQSEYGRISVDGKRIASVAKIDTKEGTPALGDTGSQNMTGLEKVRVKTPGGTFYGKVISRDDKVTTLITDDGAKLTLANADVELLTDAPKVTIGGKVGEEKPKGGKTTTKKP